MSRTSSTARCPWAVWRCSARVPLPTAPRQCGTVFHGFHVPRPTTLRHKGGVMQKFRRPLSLGGAAEYCRSFTAHYLQTLGQCAAKIPPPAAPSRCRSVSQMFYRPLPQTVRQCVARAPLQTALRQCCNNQQEILYPLPRMQCSGVLQEHHCPQPAAGWQCTNSTAHCP